MNNSRIEFKSPLGLSDLIPEGVGMKNPKTKKYTLIFTGLFILSSIVSLSHARHPAVDPVRGLSIDEYPEIAPENAQGFEFGQVPAQTSEALRATASDQAPQAPQIVTSNIPSVTQADLEGHAPSFPTLLLLTLLLGMPFGLWWFIHKKIKEETSSSFPENTIDINRARKEKEGKDDVPKAS